MSLLRRLLPAPLLSAALFLAWLLLARSVSTAQVLLGLALALAIPIRTTRLRQTGVSVRKPLVIIRYVITVIRDVIASNLEVGWGVLTWWRRQPDAKFVVIPLDLRDPAGLAVLAMVTTVVPGTVWSELALDKSALMLHVWDAPDEEAFIRRYKQRYELPLKEIFE